MVGDLPGHLNVRLDFLHRSEGKFLFFVNRAEQALIPGTVSGKSKQEASGFIGRPYGALLEIFRQDGHLHHAPVEKNSEGDASVPSAFQRHHSNGLWTVAQGVSFFPIENFYFF
jgi:hypothetical protein